MRKNTNFEEDLYKKIEENAQILGNDINKEINETLYVGIEVRTEMAEKRKKLRLDFKLSASKTKKKVIML